MKQSNKALRYKMVAGGSILVLVLTITMVANHHSHAMSQSSMSDRGPASAVLGTSQNEDQVAKEVSSRSLDASTSWGKKPSLVENLTFGLLEGKYAVSLLNGKLKELSLKSGIEDPKRLPSFENFISENRELFPVRFSTVLQGTSHVEADVTTQKYSLLNADRVSIGEVEVKLDPNGRLLAMRVVSLKL